MANPDSYNYRQNLSFTSEKPNFLKMLMKETHPVREEKEASNYSDELPQIVLGKGVNESDAQTFVEKQQTEKRPSKKPESDRPSFFLDKNVVKVGEEVEVVEDEFMVSLQQDLNIKVHEDVEIELDIPPVKSKSKQVFGQKRKKPVIQKDTIKKVKNASLLSFDDQD